MAKAKGKAPSEQPERLTPAEEQRVSAAIALAEDQAANQVERIEREQPTKLVGYLASSAKMERARFFPILPNFPDHGPLWDFKRCLARTEEQWVGYVVTMYPLGGLVLGPYVEDQGKVQP